MRRTHSPLSKKAQEQAEDISLDIIRQRNQNIETNKENQKLAEKYDELILYNKKLGEDISVVDDDQRKYDQERTQKLLKISNLKRQSKPLNDAVHQKAVQLTENENFAAISREFYDLRDQKKNQLQFLHNFFLYFKNYDYIKPSVNKTQKINELLFKEQKQLEKEIEILRCIENISDIEDKKAHIEKLAEQVERRNKILGKLKKENMNINRVFIRKIQKSLNTGESILDLTDEEDDDYNENSSEIFTFENISTYSPIKSTKYSPATSKASFFFDSEHNSPKSKSPKNKSFDENHSNNSSPKHNETNQATQGNIKNSNNSFENQLMKSNDTKEANVPISHVPTEENLNEYYSSEEQNIFSIGSLLRYSSLKLNQSIEKGQFGVTFQDFNGQVNENEFKKPSQYQDKSIFHLDEEVEALKQEIKLKKNEFDAKRNELNKEQELETKVKEEEFKRLNPELFDSKVFQLIHPRTMDKGSQTDFTGYDVDLHEQFIREQESQIQKLPILRKEIDSQQSIINSLTNEVNEAKQESDKLDTQLSYHTQIMSQISQNIATENLMEETKKMTEEEIHRSAKRLKALLKQRENIYNAIEDRIDDLEEQYDELMKTNSRLHQDLEDIKYIENSTAGQLYNTIHNFQRKIAEYKRRMNYYNNKNNQLKEQIKAIPLSERAKIIKELDDARFVLERKTHRWLIMLSDTINTLQVIEAYSFGAVTRRKMMISNYHRAERHRKIKEEETEHLEIYSKLLTSLIREGSATIFE